MKGSSGEALKLKGLEACTARETPGKKLLKRLKSLEVKSGGRVGQQLHAIASQIIGYVKQLPEQVIVMEDLNGIRGKLKKSNRLNRQLHSLPLRKTGNHRV